MVATSDDKEKIAIIGVSIRFPGANDLDSFWNIIKNAEVKTRRFSKEELQEAEMSDEIIDNPDFIPICAALEGVEFFDAEFFKISKKEAALMDPAQRIFLECSYHALEDAGMIGKVKEKQVGIFAGCGMTLYGLNSYFLHNVYPSLSHVEPLDNLQAAVGNQVDFIATRVAYRLGLKGPAVTMQTACSTSLVLVHFARQALLRKEIDCALVGTAAVNTPVKMGFFYRPGSILSRSGQCRPFDQDADGAVGGNGVCVLVLKSVEKALADGDRIYAVIAGSAVNNDGDFKAGFAAPSVNGQINVIQAALDDAGTTPDRLGHIETHGTATELGDAVEIHALQQVFHQNGITQKNSCSLGSVKANLGHLDTCAGLASFTKALLMLNYQKIPPQANFSSPLSHLRLDESPFYISKELHAWPEDKFPQKIGVSAFGFGGTNAHVILEAFAQPRNDNIASIADEEKLIFLSAKNPDRLKVLCQTYLSFLEKNPDIRIANVFFTSIRGRQHHPQRLAFLVKDPHSLQTEIKKYLDGENTNSTFHTMSQATDGKIAFLFAGQFSEYSGMARQFYDNFPAFRDVINRCERIFNKLTGNSLLPSLLESNQQTVLPTNISQPAIFAYEMALTKLWDAFGIQPDYVIGHSLGDYAVFCYAGAFSLEEGMYITTKRGELMQSTEEGLMLSVFTDRGTIDKYLQQFPQVSLAVINGETHFVLSGRTAEIEQLIKVLENAEIKWIKLPFTRAFHSNLMQSILPEFKSELAHIQFKPLKISVIDNVTATLFLPDTIPPADYFVTHLTQTMRFKEGLDKLFQEGCNTFIEIGPQTNLSRLGRSIKPEYQWLSSQSRDGHNIKEFLVTLAKLYCMNINEINFQPLFELWGGQIISLPNYPFLPETHWIKAKKSSRRAA